MLDKTFRTPRSAATDGTILSAVRPGIGMAYVFGCMKNLLWSFGNQRKIANSPPRPLKSPRLYTGIICLLID